jgi:phosphonate ABC transporter permease subunit PhnE
MGHQHLAQHRADLAELETQYRASLAKWTADDVDPALAEELRTSVAKEADAFWHEVNTVLLPALARGDMQAAEASKQKLDAIFARERGAILLLTEHVTAARNALVSTSATTVSALLAFMALAGTVLALIAAFPLAFLGARNTSPHPVVYHIVKFVANFFRTIPDFAVALVLVAAIGLGPFAGTLALAFHTATVLIKLFAEAIEGIDEGVVEAMRATGARYTQVLSFAVVPQVMPAFISFLLYRFETNIRAAAVLGMIGAGGIGFLMVSDFRMFQYQQASMTVTVLIVLVMGVDYLSAQLRKMVT